MAENEVLSDALRYRSICELVRSLPRERSGIGTLSEKSVHLSLKYFIDDDTSHHEIPVCGFVADILNDSGIHEIQTSGFAPMRRKLEAYLSSYPVEIVYPVVERLRVRMVDPESGEVVREFMSPRHHRPAEIFCELLYLGDSLTDERLSFTLVSIECEETRLCNAGSTGRRRRITRVDTLPCALTSVRHYTDAAGMADLLPYSHGDTFTADELRRYLRAPGRSGWAALKVLEELSIIRRAGKDGRKIVYEFCK